MERGASKCIYYINVTLLISAMTCQATSHLISDLFFSHARIRGSRGFNISRVEAKQMKAIPSVLIYVIGTCGFIVHFRESNWTILNPIKKR